MVWFTFVASNWHLWLKTNYFQLLCLLQIAVSVNGSIELSKGPEHLCMCYRRYWDLCVSNLSWVSFHLISLCLIPFLGFKFVFVCVYESVYIQMPSPAVTESPHWLSDIQKSLWHEMNGQFWQAAPQSSLQDFPKALPFCYVQYLQLYCLCVLIIVCDSWQVHKRYTINLPIECFSVQVWDIISCFSYLWKRYRQVHVITIVVGCFPANLREDRAFRQREVWVHLKSFYRTCQNWTLPP